MSAGGGCDIARVVEGEDISSLRKLESKGVAYMAKDGGEGGRGRLGRGLRELGSHTNISVC